MRKRQNFVLLGRSLKITTVLVNMFMRSLKLHHGVFLFNVVMDCLMELYSIVILVLVDPLKATQ